MRKLDEVATREGIPRHAVLLDTVNLARDGWEMDIRVTRFEDQSKSAIDLLTLALRAQIDRSLGRPPFVVKGRRNLAQKRILDFFISGTP
jgi:hypothetical protein